MQNDAEAPVLPAIRCGTCKFFLVNRQKIDEGACRRYPPAINLLVNGQRIMVKADFPPVLSTEWCGEHAPKPPAIAT